MEKVDRFFNRNFFIRSASALLLAPLVLYLIYQNGIVFDAMVMTMAVLMSFEWHALLISKKQTHQLLWKVIAVAYVVVPCTSLIWIAHYPGGNKIMLWLVITVWLTDIFAYIFGRMIGGPKLLPKISPNKTWAGLFGGCAAATIFGAYANNFLYSEHPHLLIALTFLLALYAQAGDFFESWVKRLFNVKDSGSLIPGHGGILDRVDGIIFTSTKVAFLLIFEPHWHIFNI